MKALGLANNERGAWNERRVLHVLSSDVPAWVRSARAATKAEDRKGIDVVVDTDVGMLYLQVKSSRKGAERFDPRGKMIGVVVAGDASEKQLRRRVLGILGELRRQVQDRRRGVR